MNDDDFCWQVALSGVRITHVSGRKSFELLDEACEEAAMRFPSPRNVHVLSHPSVGPGLPSPRLQAFHDFLINGYDRV